MKSYQNEFALLNVSAEIVFFVVIIFTKTFESHVPIEVIGTIFEMAQFIKELTPTKTRSSDLTTCRTRDPRKLPKKHPDRGPTAPVQHDNAIIQKLLKIKLADVPSEK